LFISISVIIVDNLFLVVTCHQCTNHVNVKFLENGPSLVIFVIVDLKNNSSWWCVDISLIYHHTQTHVPGSTCFSLSLPDRQPQKNFALPPSWDLTLYKNTAVTKIAHFCNIYRHTSHRL